MADDFNPVTVVHPFHEAPAAPVEDEVLVQELKQVERFDDHGLETLNNDILLIDENEKALAAAINLLRLTVASPVLRVQKDLSPEQIRAAFNATTTPIILVPGVGKAIIVPIICWLWIEAVTAYSLNPSWSCRWPTGGAGTLATVAESLNINVPGNYFTGRPMLPAGGAVTGATLAATRGASLNFQHNSAAAMTGGSGRARVVCDYQILDIPT